METHIQLYTDHTDRLSHSTPVKFWRTRTKLVITDMGSEFGRARSTSLQHEHGIPKHSTLGRVLETLPKNLSIAVYPGSIRTSHIWQTTIAHYV